jgi:hypothetical protein
MSDRLTLVDVIKALVIVTGAVLFFEDDLALCFTAIEALFFEITE